MCHEMVLLAYKKLGVLVEWITTFILALYIPSQNNLISSVHNLMFSQYVVFEDRVVLEN